MSQPMEVDDSDSEYEEEERIVLVELKGVIDSDLLTQTPFDRFKMIGIETANPVLQLNNYFFSGEYNEAIGTNIFMTEDTKKYKKGDPIFSSCPTSNLKYVCHASKVINMKRIFVASNTDESNDDKRKADESSDGKRTADDSTRTTEESETVAVERQSKNEEESNVEIS